jgi:acyl-coenzyme A synthetase/AMP-(fatty) acid ligase/3-hydroxymyristoyl/3-hydroxydecanoyl-(acyl carrier protein) dehydratase
MERAVVDAAGWRPLAHLPRTDASSMPVAWRGGKPLAASDFARQVAAWRDLLAAQSGQRWALYAEDSFEFAAALFGAWHAGKTVIVPGDLQADTVARLRDACDGFLGDLAGALARPAPAAVHEPVFAPLSREATQLVVYTSGTNGEPLAIPKKLAQLDAEVHALELRFGTLCDTGLAPANLAPETVAAGDAVPGLARDGRADAAPLVWATVTHQHIYGLLFRVLWPLAAGRPFAAERLAFNEEIAQRVASPAILVTSPAHLRRLPETVDWSAARTHLRAVFSSGGPLPPEAAGSALALLGVAPVEVYGSSETGGVAWRQRARHGDTWQPLPGIEVRIADGELCVRSPHLPDLAWWRTSDRATPAGDGMDGFELHGRADRIVKIEEKRVSLTAIEQRLGASGDVAEARVLMLANEAAVVDVAGVVVPHAVRPAVVAALTDAGRAKLQRLGKPALVAELRALLLAAVDRVALPRRWRFVDALPVNAQGKTTEGSLGALFAPPAAARPARPTPKWRIADPGHAQASLALSPDLLVFDGHFPGAPILPGVAQVDWAIAFARERFSMPARFIRMEALKFSQPALPGMHLDLELHWNAAAATLQFEYRSTTGRHSSGRVVFAESEAA